MGNDTSLLPSRLVPFSYAVWLNPNDITTNQFIMGNREGAFEGTQMNITANGEIHWYMEDNSNRKKAVKSTTVLTQNQWVNVICTYDGSSTTNGMKIYFDSVREIEIVTVDNVFASDIVSTANFQIGQRPFLNDLSFDGSMDEVSIWSKELTQSEVTAIFNKGRINVDYSTLPAIVSHWKMDNLNPTDQIGSNNGTSVNMNVSNIICE